MFYKVKEVKALPDYKLKVYFVNDVIKIYDVKPLFDTWPAFQALETFKVYTSLSSRSGRLWY